MKKYNLPHTERIYVKVNSDLFKVTELTEISGVFTVTVQYAVFPLDVVAIIVALPAETPVTTPSETVATISLLLLHVTVSVASDGVRAAVILEVYPSCTVILDLSREIPDAVLVTVTVADVDIPSSVVAVIIAVPALTPVTIPCEFTVATDSSLENHVRSRS